MSKGNIYISFRNFWQCREEFAEWLANYEVDRDNPIDEDNGINSELAYSVIDDFTSEDAIAAVLDHNTSTYAVNRSNVDAGAVIAILHDFAMEIFEAFPEVCFDVHIEQDVADSGIFIESIFQHDTHHARPFETIQVEMRNPRSDGTLTDYAVLVDELESFAGFAR